MIVGLERLGKVTIDIIGTGGASDSGIIGGEAGLVLG